MAFKQNALRLAGVLAVCSIAVFGPDVTSVARSLTETEALVPTDDQSHRQLQVCSATSMIVESFEDFEHGELSGWTLGGDWGIKTIDDSHPESFTAYLGRFGKGQTATKTYPLTRDAKGAQLSFYIYEMESRNKEVNKDHMFVTVNDVEIDLGTFQLHQGEHRSGVVDRMKWKISQHEPSAEFVINRKWIENEMHHVLVEVPEAHLHSNTLSVLFRVNAGADHKSAGIDNMMVSSCPSVDDDKPAERDYSVDQMTKGLQGQLFNFDGRNGAWYSAISAPSFQWNLRISKYENCPENADTFSTGAGFTFFDDQKKPTHRLEINVVNEHNIDVGCGAGEESCLGAGSLEMLIDGRKISVGGDYKFDNGSGRIIAYNTFYPCSHKFYGFDVDSEHSGARRLGATGVPLWQVIGGLKNSMADKATCEEWMSKRQENGDLFQQPGHYTTIIVQSESVSFHVEYKQESQRCVAHSLNVWMSQVSPTILSQEWEGIIGETKKVPVEKLHTYDRLQILKHEDDSEYEVNSPFSTKCKGCSRQTNHTRVVHEDSKG